MNRLWIEVGLRLGEEQEAHAAFDTLSNEFKVDGLIYPADLELLNDIVCLIRQRKDRYPSIKDD